MGFAKGQTPKDSFCENVDQIADAYNCLFEAYKYRLTYNNVGRLIVRSSLRDSFDTLYSLARLVFSFFYGCQ